MDAYSDCLEHKSTVKRLKLDTSELNKGESCNGSNFPINPTSKQSQIEIPEGKPPELGLECDVHSVMERLSPSVNGDSSTYMDTSHDSLDPEEDDASTVSELSGLSELSGQEWKPMGGSMTWIQKQMQSGADPRTLLVELGIELDQIPEFVDDVTLWRLLIDMLAEPPRRHKLRHVNTLDDIVRLLKGAKNILVLTGAGVSVSCGIPDFRSRDGIYSRLAIDFPDLPDPQAMFDINYFNQDPRPFFRFARDIYPGKFEPSPCHKFIKLLETHNKLLRNYTQNIDTLEKVADIKRVIECHGSFATATCTKCGYKVTAETIREIVLAQNIPVCDKCQPNIGPAISITDLKEKTAGELRDLVSAGIMKPDIVFFGEGLPDSFHDSMAEDKNNCDLLVVIGSSLKVRPVALIPSSLPSNVPQILINREPLPHCHFDVELLGDCDVIINHLRHLLGGTWQDSIHQPAMLKEALYLKPWNSETTLHEKKRKKSNNKTDTNTKNTCNCSKDSCSSLVNFACSNCKNETSSTTNEDMDKSIKERHMSFDSARDSGIGENSNLTDVDALRYSDSDEISQSDTHKSCNNLGNNELEISSFSNNQQTVSSCSSKNSFTDILEHKNHFEKVTPNRLNVSTSKDLRGYWQPKEKRCITERLPDNSYYLIQPSRYIFPGAELFFDPEEKTNHFDLSSSDSSSESDTDRDETSF